MARITINFAVEMSVDIPDDVAAGMTKQDVCSSVEMAVRSSGGKLPQVVLNNEIIEREFSWSIGPKSEELLPEELELGIFTDEQFPRLLEGSEPLVVTDEPLTGRKPCVRE